MIYLHLGKLDLRIGKAHFLPESHPITEVFRGKTVDISSETITIEATGTTEKLNALEALVSKFDLKEMVRTGKVVMARGAEPT